MEYNMPHRISGDKDLKYYEQYLETERRSLGETQSSALICNISDKPQQETKIRVENPKCFISKQSTSLPESMENKIFFQGYLKNHIGKLVKVESLIGERMESRIGILMDVGFDYIVVKLNRNCCSMVICSSAIKYITIIHNSF